MSGLVEVVLAVDGLVALLVVPVVIWVAGWDWWVLALSIPGVLGGCTLVLGDTQMVAAAVLAPPLTSSVLTSILAVAVRGAIGAINNGDGIVPLSALVEEVEWDLEEIAEQECERENTKHSIDTAVHLIGDLIAGAEEVLVVLEEARAEEHVKTKCEHVSTYFLFFFLCEIT